MRAYVLAEFTAPESMVEAARTVREAGYVDLDTHSPFPVDGAAEAIGLRPSIIPTLTAIGGATGAISGYLLQWWCNGVNYVINVGDRPPLGPRWLWLPQFIPITFELGVLFGSFFAFFGFFVLSSLPRPYHPVFQAEAFRTAAIDRFWVSVGLRDPDHEARVTALLDEAGANRVLAITDPADDPR